MFGPKGEGVSTSLLGQLVVMLAKMAKLTDSTNGMIKDNFAGVMVERTQMRADVRTEIQAVKADTATKLAAERNHLSGEIGVLKKQLAVLKNCGFDRAEWWVKTEDFFEKCLEVNDYQYESPEFHYGAFSEFSFRLILRGRGCSELLPDTSEVGVFLEQTAGSEFVAGSKFKIEVSAKGSEFRAVSAFLDAKKVYDDSELNHGRGWSSLLPKMSELRKAKDVLVSVEFDFQGQGAGVGCTRVLDINRSETKATRVFNEAKAAVIAEAETERVKADMATKLAAEREHFVTKLAAERKHLNAETAVLKKQLANLQYMLMAVLVIWVASMVTMPRNK